MAELPLHRLGRGPASMATVACVPRSACGHTSGTWISRHSRLTWARTQLGAKGNTRACPRSRASATCGASASHTSGGTRIQRRACFDLPRLTRIKPASRSHGDVVTISMDRMPMISEHSTAAAPRGWLRV
jgi:hypothetical protein